MSFSDLLKAMRRLDGLVKRRQDAWDGLDFKTAVSRRELVSKRDLFVPPESGWTELGSWPQSEPPSTDLVVGGGWLPIGAQFYVGDSNSANASAGVTSLQKMPTAYGRSSQAATYSAQSFRASFGVASSGVTFFGVIGTAWGTPITPEAYRRACRRAAMAKWVTETLAASPDPWSADELAEAAALVGLIPVADLLLLADQLGFCEGNPPDVRFALPPEHPLAG